MEEKQSFRVERQRVEEKVKGKTTLDEADVSNDFSARNYPNAFERVKLPLCREDGSEENRVDEYTERQTVTLTNIPGEGGWLLAAERPTAEVVGVERAQVNGLIICNVVISPPSTVTTLTRPLP